MFVVVRKDDLAGTCLTIEYPLLIALFLPEELFTFFFIGSLRGCGVLCTRSRLELVTSTRLFLYSVMTGLISSVW